MKYVISGMLVIELVLGRSVSTSELDYVWQGYTKAMINLQGYATDSIYAQLGYQQVFDVNTDTRLQFSASAGAWQAEVDYQLISLYGDSRQLASSVTNNAVVISSVINDEQRLFNLTHTLSQQDDYAIVHRLDRAVVSYRHDALVIKLGRQAISWGNGLVYAPMDLFNPFSPVSIDKEYKTGDDMLYAQYLNDRGDDLQLVWVGRRDEQGEITSDVSSLALKYHVFNGDSEWDLLLAEHYQDHIVGLGYVTNIGGAVWRSDLIYTRLDGRSVNYAELDSSIWSAVTNAAYSWTMLGKNAVGLIEYHYNGFGQPTGEYNLMAVAQNPALAERLSRGELYTLGKHYLALSVSLEMDPLWLLTPTIFTNIADQSTMLQLISLHNLQQELELFVAVNLPLGAEGSEFGGNQDLATEYRAFVQLAWYF